MVWQNKFKNILGIIDSSKVNNRHKIGEFKYIEIKDLVNNITNNTINELSAKKSLNKLNKLKNSGITKQKKRTPKQKELLNLFNDLLDTILTDKTLKSESQEDENVNVNKNVNENDEILMSSNEDDDENENDDKDDDNKRTKILMNWYEDYETRVKMKKAKNDIKIKWWFK